VEVADYHEVGCGDIRLHVKETAAIGGNRNSPVHCGRLDWQIHYAGNSTVKETK
jgi:hypothetical protein